MCFYVVIGHILGSITKAFGVTRLLILARPSTSIQPIVIGEVFYQLVNKTFYFQFRDAFATRLSPHQFGVAIKGGYEIVVHNIRITLNIHLDWVVLQVDITNVFNIISHRVIFQELCPTHG
jgi:hypothetical protein